MSVDADRIAALEAELAEALEERDRNLSDYDGQCAITDRLRDQLNEAKADNQRQSNKVAESVYLALTDGVSARIRGQACEPPFQKDTAWYRSWLIGYGGQECADERDAAQADIKILDGIVQRYEETNATLIELNKASTAAVEAVNARVPLLEAVVKAVQGLLDAGMINCNAADPEGLCPCGGCVVCNSLAKLAALDGAK